MKKQNYLSTCAFGLFALFASSSHAQLMQTPQEVHYGIMLGGVNQEGFLKFVNPAPAYQPNFNILSLKTVADASPITIGGNHVYFVPDGYAGVFNDLENEAKLTPPAGTYSRVFVPGQFRVGTSFTGWDNWKIRVETHPTNATFINGMLIDHKNTNGWSYGFLMKVNHDLTKAFVIENQLVAGPNKEVLKINGNGTVYCTEVNVQVAGSFPDYVFDPGYKLMSIDALEKFIQQEKHLPGIASAKEVCEKGSIAVGEMQKVLLEKIEELTLYMIQLDKENKALKAMIEELR